MKIFNNIFKKISSLEGLFSAWNEFKYGKQRKKDVMEFEYKLEENIFQLHQKLKEKIYRHGPYKGFWIQDPKPRHIHKALVKDRIVHHALFSVLNSIFEPTFIYDSYSCRKNKGTHKGINKLRNILRKVSKNNHQDCFVLKCDVKKFFASIDHEILVSIITKKIKDGDAIWLIKEIVESFSPGLPIGNLTSQIFANIYLNELDQFIKNELRIPFYLRYTDDFVIVENSKEQLNYWLSEIRRFLLENLRLELHPKKVILCKYHQGMDFLGYVQFPNHRVLRQKTKRRILNRVNLGISKKSLQSYLGVLSHANSYELSEKIKNLFWLNRQE